MAIRGQQEFLNLPFQEKLDFLYGLPARQKRDLILSAPEARRLVQSFSPETLFYTVKEIGSADAGELLELARPEQVRSLFDLDCWKKDRPNLDRMREWVEALAEGGRRGLADGLMELDLELVSIFLRDYIKVHLMDDPASSPDAPSNRFEQFDEHYLIEYTRQDQVSQYVSDFIEEAFERDYRYFAGLMDGCYWGVAAEMEEQAYQFRIARLNDRGFPDYFEAQDVFAYLNPEDFRKIRAGHEPPSREDLLEDGEVIPPGSAPALTGGDDSQFNLALTAGFAAQGKRQLRAEMAMVANQVIVARSIDFGDMDAVREAVESTHNYLNLGLEHLAGGSLENAIEELRDTPLKLLFRLGVSLTIDLRTSAQALVRRLGLDPSRAREISYLDSPHRDALAAMLASRPKYFSGIDGRGEMEVRDFCTMREVRAGYAIVDQVGAISDLFSELLAINISSPRFRAQVAAREIRLGQVLSTAMVRAAVEGRFDPEPIEAGMLGAVRTAIIANGPRPAALNESFRASIADAFRERLSVATIEGAADFVKLSLAQLEEEFGALEAGAPIDGRFIGSVLVKLG
jgi:hypothetical protein